MLTSAPLSVKLATANPAKRTDALIGAKKAEPERNDPTVVAIKADHTNDDKCCLTSLGLTKAIIECDSSIIDADKDL